MKGSHRLVTLGLPVFAGDVTPPTCVLTTAAPDPVLTANFTVTATFSEDVFGFVVGDITVTNGAASGFIAASASVYTFVITPVVNGTVTTQVLAGVCADAAGNANTASNVLSRAFVANLAHWYNLDSLSRLYQDSAMTTPVTGGDDPVGAWVDQIVAADEVAQAVTAAKPTYRASVAALNNRPALQFDGGDSLQGAFSAAITQPDTVYAVIQRISGSSTYFFDSDGIDRQVLFSTATNYRYFAGLTVNGVVLDTTANIHTIVYNGASSEGYINGSASATGDFGANAMDGLTVGARQGGTLGTALYFAEILFYSGIHDAATKNIVQDYLAAKYGISVTEFS